MALSLKPEQPEDKKEDKKEDNKEDNKEEQVPMIEFQPEFTKSLYRELFRIYNLKDRLKRVGSPIYKKTDVFKDENYKKIIDNELTPEILSTVREIVKGSGKTGLKNISEKVRVELEKLPSILPLSKIYIEDD